MDSAFSLNLYEFWGSRMGIFFYSSELEDVLLICSLGCNVENPIHS